MTAETTDYTPLKAKYNIFRHRECVVCGEDITALRPHAIYCSHTCTQRAYVYRKTLAQQTESAYHA